MARNMWVTVARSESSRRTAQSAWRRLRRTVLDRDGDRCQIRGPRCLTDATTVDHIIPVFLGGEDCEDNAQAVCRPCHDTKTAQERAAAWPRPSRKRPAAMHPSDAPEANTPWGGDSPSGRGQPMSLSAPATTYYNQNPT